MATATLEEPKARPSQDARFIPVHIDSLDASVLEMDVWVQFPSQASPTLYRSTGISVDFAEIQRLREQKVEFVYIPTQQHAAYRRQLQAKLDRMFTDPAVMRAERKKIIRANCAKMIEEVLLLPGRSEPIATIADVAKSFVTWSDANPGEFGYLLDMSAHDFYTSTHMVNVGVGCALLVRHLKPGDAEAAQIAVQGGLLHDIGKREIPETLLNKEGKLTEQEFGVIKTHPGLGFEELSRHNEIDPIILEMARDHHERLDGKGYPNGRKGEEIGFFARVCAVVDVFDALTAARPYRGPMHPSDAITVMTDGIGTQFDPAIFNAWKTLIGDLLRDDPARASGTTSGSAAPPLADMLPRSPSLTRANLAGPEPVPTPHILSGAERRRFERKDCAIQVTVVFTQQTRVHPVGVGQPVTVIMKDISCGGLGIVTPFPFAKGDRLHIMIPSPGGIPLRRHAKVVSVRHEERQWRVGLQFIASE